MVWSDVASLVSALAAVVAGICALYSHRVAKRSLDVERRAAQAAFEGEALARAPAVTVLLTELEYRRCATVPETQRDPEKHSEHQVAPDPGALEVVVCGQLTNNLDQQVLLTFRDHPRSGRNSWGIMSNEAMVYLDGQLVRRGQTVLGAGGQARLLWVDRRTRSEWALIHDIRSFEGLLDCLRRLRDQVRGRSPVEIIVEVVRLLDLLRKTMSAPPCSGFELACEPRTQPRVVTVWIARVRRPALLTWRFGQDDDDPTGDMIGTVDGPLDDQTVYYRAGFNSVLAQVEPPRIRYLAGRGP